MAIRIILPSSSTPTGQVFSSNGAVPGQTTDTLLATGPTLSAASLGAGQCYRLDLDGNIDAIATSGGFIIKIKLNGATAITATVVASQTSAGTAKPWYINSRLWIEATASGGIVTTTASALQMQASGAFTALAFQDVSHAIDLSGGLAITVTIANITANAGNLTRLLHGVLVRVA
jgi:hypothetical protein